jgi:hypothetical protein
MSKRLMSALAIAAIAYVGVAQAQTNATLTLKSGERISGHLVDLGGVGFTVRVNNEERRIPTNDVAVIDFTGSTMSPADWARITSGQHMVWMRNGETITGQLYDIAGTTPKKIILKTDGGERTLLSSDVDRIVLARTDAAAAARADTAATPSTGTGGSGLVVSAKQAWTSTGLVVRQGEVLTFNTTGEIMVGPNQDDVATSAGVKAGRFADKAPVARLFAGALIGRINNGQPFAIGDQASVVAPATGRLFLGINDDQFENNTGEFRVEITRTGGRRR